MAKKPRNSNDPYRIIVWGPGVMGQGCIREIVKRPEFKLVGVLCYSEAKVGKDAGELIGHAPLGVKCTNDKEAIYALDADVVIWTGLPIFDPVEVEGTIIRLLESGKNVVTPAVAHYAHQHGRAYVERFEAACRKGNSSLHGTGENPGFWFERMVPTLTGLCTSVETIKLVEYADCAQSTPEMLRACGFGMSEQEARVTSEYLHRMWSNYYFIESIDLVCQTTWGRSMDRFDFRQTYYPAAKDIVLDQAKGDPTTISIEKGKICGITYDLGAVIEGEIRASIQVNWFLRPENAPFPVSGGDNWHIEIEGKPVSLRCDFDLYASLKGNQEFNAGNKISMAWYVTIVTLIQAIPLVVGAEPGLVVPSVFANCVPDFRQLEKRKSLVDRHHYKE